MLRKPILEFSENHWNDRSSDPFQGNRQHRRVSFTFLYKHARLAQSQEHSNVTDYSTAIIGLIAFTAIVSAAVVYVLAQPSDLPVVKKDKAVKG